MSTKYFLMIIILGLVVLQCSPSKTSSILIKDATIIDGTGKSQFQGSVRIENGLISAIGDLEVLDSDSILDGSGMILAPGFIDSHSHNDRDTLRNVDAAISQGITTIIAGQDGRSQPSLQAYFDSLSSFPLSVNIGSFVGHGSVRLAIMGYDDFKREATPGEINKMKTLIEEEMKSGALGLGTGLEYDPGIYSSTYEVIELAKVASAHGGRYASHMRSEDIYFEQSLEEILQIGKEAQIPVQISHFKLGRKSLWGKAPEILAKLDSARQAGIDVTADIYPYEYWQSTMTVLFPKRDFQNRESAEFALSELTSPEGMIISRFNANPEYEGLTLDKIAELRGEDPIDTYMALIKMSQEIPGESIIAKSMDIEDIKIITNWEHTNICSDGGPSGHPRGWGAFPRFLNIETGASMEEKIQKMTSKAAQNLGLDSIGQIRVGYPADLILFDPEDFVDKATYEESSQRSTGLHLVMVSGEIVYVDQSPTNKYPGKIIKRRY
jgi:N-acyl-D-amino-acid deacylase